MPPKKETWVEIAITVHGDLVDAVSNFMTEIGALGVYEESLEPQEDSDFEESRPEAVEPPTEEIIKAYLLKDNRLDHRLASLDAYIHSLRSLFPDYPMVTYTTQIVNDADWAEGWKKYFKPIRVTKNIIIKPTWERYAAVGHDIVIEMDPGMAFGTGQHASTRMCLEALENIILHEKTANPRHVLDIGSGTGILGIAAAKLGAKKVTCVDIDPLATEISLENIKINHVEEPGGSLDTGCFRLKRHLRSDRSQPHRQGPDQVSFPYHLPPVGRRLPDYLRHYRAKPGRHRDPFLSGTLRFPTNPLGKGMALLYP